MSETTDKQWYVTVGVPGGDYACRTECSSQMRYAFCTQIKESFAGAIELEIDCNFINYRPAPPDLAEWLDAEMHNAVDAETNRAQLGTNTRTKVPGGWFYVGGAGGSAAAVFVPVAGASGITVIGGEVTSR